MINKRSLKQIIEEKRKLERAANIEKELINYLNSLTDKFPSIYHPSDIVEAIHSYTDTGDLYRLRELRKVLLHEAGVCVILIDLIKNKELEEI